MAGAPISTPLHRTGSATLAAMAARLPCWLALAAMAVLVFPIGGEEARGAGGPPSLLLITLDTTRADALGAWGGGAAASTPNLDELAAAGVRYARAVAPSPLTLPSHATLLTGLDPLEHGVRGNGTGALPPDVATLAGSLGGCGFATAAVVGSRVLDRRFGLDRGFERYDDAMLAERVGEYGYPERPADAVTDAAVRWLAGADPRKPFFLWVHYYDPHAPYVPPAELAGVGERGSYLGEVAFVDREVGRLVAAARGRAPALLVAAVGDHGEAFGEHRERGHGIFLYRATVEVPMILAGPGVPRGVWWGSRCATRRLAATLLDLLGRERGPAGPAAARGVRRAVAPPARDPERGDHAGRGLRLGAARRAHLRALAFHRGAAAGALRHSRPTRASSRTSSPTDPRRRPAARRAGPPAPSGRRSPPWSTAASGRRHPRRLARARLPRGGAGAAE